jgi:hypothetical protein
MKRERLESIREDLFRTIKSDAFIGGSTVFMTLQLTFQNPKSPDRVFDQESDL